MGKIVVTEFVSLDGVFEDPGGSEGTKNGPWTFKFNRGPEGDKLKFDEVMQSEAQLLGRVTYEGFAKAWPTMTDEVGFADRFNNMPKYVVSTTLKHAGWNNSTVLSPDLVSEVRRLKERHQGDILVSGSGQLVRGLLGEGLVDQLNLMVFPVVLGQGRRLFEDTSRTTMRLLSNVPVGPDGVMFVTYAPVAAGVASHP